MTLTFVATLGLTSSLTNVNAQKINGSFLEIYSMVLAKFFLQDNENGMRFLEKTFLLADTSMEMVLEMFFFFFGSANF